jgi:hypothetical protein
MVESFKNFLTLEQIEWLRSDMAEKFATDRVTSRPYDREKAKQIYNVDTDVLDLRVVLDHSDRAFKIIEKTFRSLMKQHVQLYVAYQRQILPHSIHVDEPGDRNAKQIGKSCIIPLYENTNNIFKTIVWKQEFFTNEELIAGLLEINTQLEQGQQLPELSHADDVDHCVLGNRIICNYLELDGIYNYELGSLGMFDRTYVHASSNWRKYNVVDHKDVILIHAT